MRRVTAAITGAVAGWAMVVIAGTVCAETYELKLVRLEPLPATGVPQQARSELLYRATGSQSMVLQPGVKRPDDPTEEFRKLVKKEPEKYQAKEPFRGVMKLGSQKYPFVLDAKDETAQGYDRLYFDRNGNGDLSDEHPLDAESPKLPAGTLSSGLARCQFPRLDLTLNVEGRQIEYSFFLSTYRQDRGTRYVSVSLNAGAYRVAEITLDGKPHQVALLDYNSNGRFDDEVTISESRRGSDGQLYPQYGDLLLVDAEKGIEPTSTVLRYQESDTRQWVSKLARIDDKLYELKVSPGGDQLTLTPTRSPTGYLTNPNAPFSAIVYGDRGFLQIRGDAGKPASVPEGQWKLLSYNLQRTDWKEPAPPATKEDLGKKQEAGEKQEPAKTSGETAPKPTVAARVARYYPEGFCLASGQATADYPAVTVRPGETATLPFGPPYVPVVRAVGWVAGAGKVAPLSLAVRGASGEWVTSLIVDGQRPPKPEFTITDPKGEKVADGQFEFG